MQFKTTAGLRARGARQISETLGEGVITEKAI